MFLFGGYNNKNILKAVNVMFKNNNKDTRLRLSLRLPKEIENKFPSRQLHVQS